MALFSYFFAYNVNLIDYINSGRRKCFILRSEQNEASSSDVQSLAPELQSFISRDQAFQIKIQRRNPNERFIKGQSFYCQLRFRSVLRVAFKKPDSYEHWPTQTAKMSCFCCHRYWRLGSYSYCNFVSETESSWNWNSVSSRFLGMKSSFTNFQLIFKLLHFPLLRG